MLLEDRIKKAKEYHEVKIESFDNYFECRELTAKEQREMLKLTLQGAESVDFDSIGGDGIKINLGDRISNHAEAMMYLIETAYKSAKKKTGKKQPIKRSILETLSDLELDEFVEAYKKEFDNKEDKDE